MHRPTYPNPGFDPATLRALSKVPWDAFTHRQRVEKMAEIALSLESGRVLCVHEAGMPRYVAIVGAKRRVKRELRSVALAMYLRRMLDRGVDFVWTTPEQLTQLEVAHRLGGLALCSTVARDLGVQI